MLSTSVKTLIAIPLIAFGCGTPEEDKKTVNEEIVEEVNVEEVETTVYWVVDEHKFNDIPVTTAPKKAAEKAAAPAGKSDAKVSAVENPAAKDNYEVLPHAELQRAFVEVEYEMVTEIEVTESIVPLDETQTLVSYNGKGKYQDSLQVILDGSGNVEQVVFAHKNHKDIYDVENGMSVKEVKNLRKEMKHMMKNGKHFLYDDTSNIMYLLNAQDSQGNELTDVEIDQLSVDAIIWKDKKHHKKADKKS